MASSVIKRSADFKFVTLKIDSITLQPNEVKYFGCPKPNDNNYYWILYAVQTGTWAIAVNDFNNVGIRFKNNNATQSTTGVDIEFYWMGVRS